MATSIPAKLKTLDISRFAQRGSQLEKFKPPVAYWCYYWVVNQILSKGLHSADEACKVYTTSLMDKLEEMKTKNSTDAAILEDAAGRQFVEQFGLQTFERAENAMRSDKATMQTVETFHAASTFLDTLQIWGPSSPELTQKTKYAKYHALRIAKALKAGEDPNLSNPPPQEPEPSVDSIHLDPNDPEVQKINGIAGKTSVENASNEHESLQPSIAPDSSMDQPARNESLRPDSTDTESTRMWQPPASSPNSQGYFNQAPSHQTSMSTPGPPLSSGNSAPVSPPSPNPPTLPQAPVSPADVSTVPFEHPAAPSSPNPQDFYTQPPAPTAAAAPLQPPYPPSSQQKQYPAPQSYVPPSSQSPLSPPQPNVDVPSSQNYASRPPQNYTQPPPVTHIPPQSSSSLQTFNVDDQAMADAQKHAKWAVSALNFEDVNTAVKELRIALKALGAQ